MLQRAKIAKQISSFILDEQELTDADVEILRDVVFALKWSAETNSLLKQQLIPLQELNAKEMLDSFPPEA